MNCQAVAFTHLLTHSGNGPRTARLEAAPPLGGRVALPRDRRGQDACSPRDRVLRLDDHLGGRGGAVEGDGGSPVEMQREAFGLAVGHGDGAGGVVLRERVGERHVLVRLDALRPEAALTLERLMGMGAFLWIAGG